ncbi:MAG: nucleotidyltransferase family protein [Vampirovibrionales bacterium]|nr:nucleotidyltransferase family protein [Vampirovibrionales bacterium]
MLAVILAGGKGTRLKPYTTVFPKALAPLGEMPVLEWVLRQLKAAGFDEIILSVGHLAHLIETYFGDGASLGLKITYAREETPLGTAGPLRAIADLPEQFLVMNADILCDLDYRAFFEAHCASGALATVSAYRRDSRIDFGILHFDGAGSSPQAGRIQGFEEKPTLHHWVSMGVYAFRRDICAFIPDDRPFGFDDLMHALIAAQADARAIPFDGYWLDIGRVDDYDQAMADVQTQRDRLLPGGMA